MGRQIRIALALGVLLLALGTQSRGQTATITGIVQDSGGGVVPGATVELRNEGTQWTRTQDTDAAGDYTFVALQPGTYSLKVTAKGFNPVTVTGILLTVDQTARNNVTVGLSQVTQQVVVTAAVPMLQTDEASVGQVIGAQQIVDLPLNGRSFKQLALLLPGTLPATTQNNNGMAFDIPRGNFQSNGTLLLGYSYRIDGVENFHKFEGTNLLDLSLDAIQEFKIKQNNYAVDAGRGTTDVSIVTKSGTNSYHGTAFEFLRNDMLDARNFFDKTQPGGPPGGKGAFRMNQFGGSVGGPIRKDKSFLFVDFEALRSVQDQTQFGNFPTQAELQGDLSGTAPARDETLVGTSVCPTGTEPGCFFPNNQIPQDRISQFAKAAIPYYPVPNAPGILQGVNTVALLKGTNNFTQETVRFDETLGSSDQLTARESTDSSRFNVPSISPDGFLNTTYHTTNLGIHWTRAISSQTVNDLLVGYNFGNYRLEVATSPVNLAPAFGLMNVVIPNPGWFGLPNIRITGSPNLGPASTEPWFEPEKILQFSENLSLIRGSHTIKIGGEFMRWQNDSTQPYVNRGTLKFTGIASGNPIADFLLGWLGGVQVGQGDDSRSLLRYLFPVYVGDDWKVSSKLTINIGLRWEAGTMPVEKNNKEVAFDPDLARFPGDVLGAFRQAGVDGTGRSVIDSDLATLAPRFGFAYRPFSSNRFVVRGGFGVFYALGLQGQEEQQLALNMPFIFITNTIVPNAASFIPTTSLFAPPPPLYPDPNAAFAALGQSMETLPTNIKFPTSNQYNLAFQTLLTRDLSLDISYVGDSSHHLEDRYNVNQAVLPSPAEVASGVFSSVASRRPFPTLGNAESAVYWGNQNYNALQVKAEKHFNGGVSFLGSYTFGKTIDDVDIVGPESAQYYWDRALEKGRSSLDVRQMFTLSYTAELPFGPGRRYLSGATGALRQVVEGWSVNGITSYRTGSPLTLAATFDNTQTSSLGPRPDRICDGNLPSSQRTPNLWFQTSCFVEPQAGTLGTAGRRIIDGPGFQEYDFSLFKRFTLSERTRLEFRTEAFNIFNHANFGPPGLTLGTSTFGVITSAAAPREIQFGLKLLF